MVHVIRMVRSLSTENLAVIPRLEHLVAGRAASDLEDLGKGDRRPPTHANSLKSSLKK